jgi:hypothetical protein
MSVSRKPFPSVLRGGVRILREFVRNLVVTFAMPVIDVARAAGGFEIPRPKRPRLKPLTENPAGRSLNSLVVRGIRRLTGRSIGTSQPILNELSHMAASGRTLVIGPWLSEVGFEVLYWIPFLQWAVREHSIDPSRILVVSRGGVEPWYRHLGGRYIDLLDHFTPAEFRELNERRIAASGHQKHMELGETDRVILDRVCAAEGVLEYDVLHPAMMYQLLLPLWQRRAPPGLAFNHSLYLPMVHPDAVFKPPGLPARYTAAKFYFSDAFPHSNANVEKVRRLLHSYLREGPVVLLMSGVQMDDHTDLLEGLPKGVTVIAADDPARNLLLQTAVVAGAERFIGTYGGFSYLAPLLGVPSLCVYSDLGRLMPIHMDIAFRVFRRFACGHSEKGCAPNSIGEMPAARFTPVHIDALADIPLPHVGFI